MFWFLVLLPLLFPHPVFAVDWTYPISDYFARQTQKGFAQYIDNQWYLGKEALFPNQFTGYHTGIDLEIFPAEANQPVPVSAVTSGQVSFAGPVSGYGGVILFRPDNEAVTYLYGHVKLTGVRAGESYSAGQTLTYLGDAFSSQTGGERKHLHFAIYRGTGNYFRGYESTLPAVNSRFLDPNQYLQARIKVSPSPTILPDQPSTLSPQAENPEKIGFWTRFLNWLKSLF
jgi:murein DD-endopeptidase MepM/ murein hydrolase activator NlpD